MPYTTPMILNPGALTCGSNPGSSITTRLRRALPLHRNDPHRHHRRERRPRHRHRSRDARRHGAAVGHSATTLGWRRNTDEHSGDRVDIRNLRFNVLVEGEGPDVLLVHGFPDSNSVWRHQIPALVNAGYRVIAPDLQRLRRVGPLLRSAYDYKIDEFVDDLVAILDALEVRHGAPRRATTGAPPSAGRPACKHAERIDRYAALAVGHPSRLRARRRRPEAQGLLRRSSSRSRRCPRRLVSANDWWLWRQMLRYDAEMPTWKADLSRPGRLTAAINIYRANPRPHPAQGQAQGHGADDGHLG